ncbi:hypothetical protein ACIG56_00200 [Nocardia fusca]|uniref:hypothetical protein n=1 Tax=Nocardia fusca TaxID=941183 RepID=UPI0037C5E5C0
MHIRWRISTLLGYGDPGRNEVARPRPLRRPTRLRYSVPVRLIGRQVPMRRCSSTISQASIIARYSRVDLLCIDELGTAARRLS